MITTVGELRTALRDYGDDNPLVVLAGGGAQGEQYFPIASVGHDPGQTIINLGDEFVEGGE